MVWRVPRLLLGMAGMIIIAAGTIYLGSGIYHDIYVHGLGTIEIYGPWHHSNRFFNLVLVAAGLAALFVVLRKMYGKI